ncbi:uncharacterized protein LOC134675930 [Cydia fagiglandana]|uniref:uncharacterized protein LOC134675930 n=1 Tax=Cydia fagiglandana TaxID=1458189 RepID=UPI002FEE3D58
MCLGTSERATNTNVEAKKFPKIDNFTEDLISRIIYDSYRQNIVVTIDSLLKKIQECDENFPYGRTTLCEYLKHTGFSYKTLDKRQKIMESPRLVDLRKEYLKKIREFRSEGRNIVVTDETWYDTHDIVKKGWVDTSGKCCLNAPCSRGQRVIILLAGSKHGSVPGSLLLSAKNIKTCSADYHEDMTANLYEKWFQEQLLPNLPPNSVIVLDNASYHSRQAEKIPNTSSRKADIITFLQERNQIIPPKIKKKALLDRVQSLKPEKKMVIDELAKESGHTVLRLPPYYCQFNPIELVWSELKQRIRRNNTQPQLNSNVVELVREETMKIANNVWTACFSHVEGIENTFILQDQQRFVINVTESSDLYI